MQVHRRGRSFKLEGQEYMLFCHGFKNALVAFSPLTLLVGQQEGHLARKKIWGDGGDGHWLVDMEWRPAGWSVCLPVLISPCTTKFRSSMAQPDCWHRQTLPIISI